MAKAAKRDLYQEVTDRVVAALEEGTAPWTRSWTNDPTVLSMPVSGATGRPYSGVNVLLLWLTASENGFASNEWYTYNGAKKAGGNVRKGASGTTVVFFKPLTIEETDDITGEVTKKKIPLIKNFTLFNRDQIDGLPEVAPITPPEEFEVHAAAQAFIDGAGSDLRHGGNRAYYSPLTDHLQMPQPTQFADQASYYSTTVHELTHWTGHKSRMDRDQKGTHGTPSYAFEELVAEMGAAFASADLGLQGNLQHPEYIANWIQVLTSDKKALIRASSQARKAHQFLVDAQAASNKEAA